MRNFTKMPVEKYHALTVVALKFFLPWAFAAFYIISIFFVFRERSAEFVALMGTYFITPLGKGSIISAAVVRGFHPSITALYTAAMDVIVGLFFAWNWDLILKMPKIGYLCNKIMSRGVAFLEQHIWVRKLAFTGIVLFMTSPVQPGGSITATIFGRIIGLKTDKVIYAIAIGATISSFAFAYLANGIIEVFRQSVYLGIGALIFLAVVVHFAYHKYAKSL
ncbi:MAG: small multi-drug export protein [Candidatus Aenigmarchaeota archaeon]|nr:small multi-drug export protein [Candidatus Aenigmarchaeota archaeon]